jgi:hypothetical protein
MSYLTLNACWSDDACYLLRQAHLGKELLRLMAPFDKLRAQQRERNN